MSVRVMSYVWEHSRHKGSTLLLLLAIADFADDHGRNARPSVKTLARKIRMSPRTVQLLLAQLADGGEAAELTVDERAGKHGTHLYRVVVPWSDSDGMPRPGRPPKKGGPAGKTGRGAAQSLRPFSGPDGGSNPRGGGEIPGAGGANSDASGVQNPSNRDAIAVAPDPSSDPSGDPSSDPSDGDQRAREAHPPLRAVPKPGEVASAERAACPVWAAMVAAAGGAPIAAEELAEWDRHRLEALAAWDDPAGLAAEFARRAARYRRAWPHLAFSVPGVWRNWAKLAAGPPPARRVGRAGAAGTLFDPERYRAALGGGSGGGVSRPAENDPALADLLAALGATADDQAAWHTAACATLRLPPVFQGAVFGPPTRETPAALVFRDAEARERADAHDARGRIETWARRRHFAGREWQCRSGLLFLTRADFAADGSAAAEGTEAGDRAPPG